MNDLRYSNALHEQLRDLQTYAEQVGNVLFGIFRLLGLWVVMTATYASGTAIIVFISTDISAYSQIEWQQGLRLITTVSGGAAALACLFGNGGKFRNIFSAKAAEHVKRFNAVKESVQSQIDITESLLVRHGLITDIDVEQRRAGLQHRHTPPTA